MDGAKSFTDTIDDPKGRGRQAYSLDRTFFERREGPSINENPGGSRIIDV